MSATCCAAFTAAGEPCQARPLPDRDYCLFHDPDRAALLAEARSRGGAAPRRHFRRLPRLLDHRQIAELLAEVWVEALNDPQAIDIHRLRVLLQFGRTLLQAVGVPKDAFHLNPDLAEPAAEDAHLLRVYPLPSSDLEALLDTQPDPARPTPQAPSLDPPVPRNSQPDPHPTPNIQSPTPSPVQVLNRSRTGLPATIDSRVPYSLIMSADDPVPIATGRPNGGALRVQPASPPATRRREGAAASSGPR